MNMLKKDSTIEYYNANAGSFYESTISADVSSLREKFLALLPEKAMILDFGCGSGRDTKAFLDLGYCVEALDGSEELCRAASEYTGIEVQKMLFRELTVKDRYDGIWACASILHLDRAELEDVFLKMADALKKDGVLYTGFKYGTFEGLRGERYFTDFTEESFQEFLKEIPDFLILETWITTDVRPGREEEKWINILLRRN